MGHVIHHSANTAIEYGAYPKLAVTAETKKGRYHERELRPVKHHPRLMDAICWMLRLNTMFGDVGSTLT